MAFHQMHLNKSGSGMSSKTACGRNVLRTPMSANWEDFKVEGHRCAKCEQSKQFELNTRADLTKWVPEDPDAWKKSDDALMMGLKQAKAGPI